MALHHLHLEQFRSYSQAMFTFNGGVNVIVGPNGIGKTNLLEAIYVVATGGSFRVSDKQLLQYNQQWFRVDATFDDHERSLRYALEQTPAKKFFINGTHKKRITRDVRLPVVLFEPETLRMLTGSPTRRRAYLDTLLAEWYEDGTSLLRRYERVLLQRNNLLKRAPTLSPQTLDDQLFAWDVSLAELASIIEEYRRAIVAKINQYFSEEYSRIASKASTVRLHYIASHAHSESAYLHVLKEHRALDIARTHTTIGPHRSDFSVLLNGQPAELTASRGEQRSIVLALKFIEMRELEAIRKQPPLLLLDDVMSELDQTRQQQLLQKNHAQIILTTAAVEALPLHAKAHTIKLAAV
ncbi:MAG TPA: DNA replication/repair protein RecF [Candidatus Saccharimonadales bacterium]